MGLRADILGESISGSVFGMFLGQRSSISNNEFT